MPVGSPGRAPDDRKPKRSMAQAQQSAPVADLVRAMRAPRAPRATPSREGVDNAAHHVHGDDDRGGHGRTRNVRNGSRTKTVLTDNAGKVDVTGPRARAGTFEPVIVYTDRKLESVEEPVHSLA